MMTTPVNAPSSEVAYLLSRLGGEEGFPAGKRPYLWKALDMLVQQFTWQGVRWQNCALTILIDRVAVCISILEAEQALIDADHALAWRLHARSRYRGLG